MFEVESVYEWIEDLRQCSNPFRPKSEISE